ncbi:MAG: FAD-binding protein, partial [Thermodesulfobacteriota bacterium]|nr:FAD-binding protein [Thermodesulfobacteriota bacterium]
MHEITTETVPSINIDKVRCIKGHSKIAKDYNAYLSDESRLAHKGAEYIFFPKDEAELSSVFREMSKKGIKIALSGARTGLVGGAVPYGGAIVSLERFNKFLDLRYDGHLKEWLVRAQCAVIMRDLNN